jgi:hypothetical protein
MSDAAGPAEEKNTSTNLARPQPLNATMFKRQLPFIVIKLPKRFRERKGTVVFLANKICVKYGMSVNLGEVTTMQFVQKHTLVPVLCVYLSAQPESKNRDGRSVWRARWCSVGHTFRRQ